jgi:hypothetical protein
VEKIKKHQGTGKRQAVLQEGNENAYSPETKKVITTAGVYKVMTYRR